MIRICLLIGTREYPVQEVKCDCSLPGRPTWVDCVQGLVCHRFWVRKVFDHNKLTGEWAFAGVGVVLNALVKTSLWGTLGMPANQQIWLKEPVSAPYDKNTLHFVNFNTKSSWWAKRIAGIPACSCKGQFGGYLVRMKPENKGSNHKLSFSWKRKRETLTTFSPDNIAIPQKQSFRLFQLMALLRRCRSNALGTLVRHFRPLKT